MVEIGKKIMILNFELTQSFCKKVVCIGVLLAVMVPCCSCYEEQIRQHDRHEIQITKRINKRSIVVEWSDVFAGGLKHV